jgi:CRISPR-associated exonuclease Cas4
MRYLPFAMSQLLFLLFFFLLLAAIILWVQAGRGRETAGLPVGEVVYADTGAWQRNEKPLFSNTYQLVGKPDYLVREGRNLIPVEVKTRHAPAAPYLSHVMQLAAYCLLVEEVLSAPAPYGLIHYRDKTFRVEFTKTLRAALLQLLSDMQRAVRARAVHRSHQRAGRCARCGFQAVCGERLTASSGGER